MPGIIVRYFLACRSVSRRSRQADHGRRSHATNQTDLPDRPRSRAHL